MESIRKSLVEPKCRLGFVTNEQEDTISKLGSPDVNSPINSHVYIDLDKYKNILDENISYTFESINERKLELIYQNWDVSDVVDFSLDIISEGNNNEYKYKVNAKIIFKTKKENNQFKTSYNVKSYDKVNN